MKGLFPKLNLWPSEAAIKNVIFGEGPQMHSFAEVRRRKRRRRKKRLLQKRKKAQKGKDIKLEWFTPFILSPLSLSFLPLFCPIPFLLISVSLSPLKRISPPLLPSLSLGIPIQDLLFFIPSLSHVREKKRKYLAVAHAKEKFIFCITSHSCRPKKETLQSHRPNNTHTPEMPQCSNISFGHLSSL